MIQKRPQKAEDKRPGGSSASGPTASPWQFPIWPFLLMIVLVWFWQESVSHLTVRTIPYSEFKTRLQQKEVAEVNVALDEVTGRIVPRAMTNEVTAAATSAGGSMAINLAEAAAPPTGSAGTQAASNPPAPQTGLARFFTRPTASSAEAPTTPYYFRTVRVEDPALVKELQEAGVKFTGSRPSFLSQLLLAWVLPIGVMVALWIYLGRRFAKAGGGLLSIGKSKAKLVAENATGVSFDDVAGCDEAKVELQEIVDFLKNPGRYKSLGARIPKGALLVGPPGTGKTLLARAVAGEAGVPFFSLSGSDFVEMFVGVGAARVRDLFQQAKAQAPCIIFIDELDAIGRQRGVHVGAVNDEREQTLNQLLVEMDGFEANAGIIILAATNRPEVLDRALLRPGRFDRQVLVDAPDAEGRLAILGVHARNKPLGASVQLRRIAQATPGFSGADLANTLNEAALLAARRGSEAIEQRDLEEAIEKVVAGPERKGRRLKPAEKRRVAYHEAGHALVAAHSPGADPVHKISIVPRGRAALGYTLQLPAEDTFLQTRSELLGRIRGLLGGRAAEELILGEVSSGAQNDLERATALARQMVAVLGMSSRVGLTSCLQRPGSFLAAADSAGQRDCSEQTAREIDEEVRQILELAYTEAKELLAAYRTDLERVTAELLRHETLDAGTFYQLIGKVVPQPQATGEEPARLAAAVEVKGI
jgi:cell division protease FtsH